MSAGRCRDRGAADRPRVAVICPVHGMGRAVVEMLADELVDVVVVIIARPRPRARFDQDVLVGTCAAAGIPVIVIDGGEASRVVTALAAQEPDLLVMIDWRGPVSPALLATARLGGVAIHPSLLPKYSGPDAVNWAILRGEQATGATLVSLDRRGLLCNAAAQRSVRIGANDTFESVSVAVDEASAELLGEYLPTLLSGRPLPQCQPLDPLIAPLPARTPDMGVIDWTLSARMVHDWVRGLTMPDSGAFTTLGGRKVMVWATRLPSPREPAGPPGEVIGFDRGGVRIGVRDGSVVVRRMSYPDYPPVPAGLWCRVSGVGVGSRFDLAPADRVAWARGEGWRTPEDEARSVS